MSHCETASSSTIVPNWSLGFSLELRSSQELERLKAEIAEQMVRSDGRNSLKRHVWGWFQGGRGRTGHRVPQSFPHMEQ